MPPLPLPSRTAGCDPKEPVAAFWANDWSRRGAAFGPKVSSTTGNLDFESRYDRIRYAELRGRRFCRPVTAARVPTMIAGMTGSPRCADARLGRSLNDLIGVAGYGIAMASLNERLPGQSRLCKAWSSVRWAGC